MGTATALLVLGLFLLVLDIMGEEHYQTMNTVDTNGDVIITKDGSMETISSSSLLEYKCFTEINKAMGTLSCSMVAATGCQKNDDF